MTTANCSPPLGRRRSGFTFFEVIISVAIILLLLAGMFTFYEFSLSIRQRTQTAATEAQLARALMDQMARDLQSTSAVTSFIRERTVERLGFIIRGADSGTAPAGSVVGEPDAVAFLSSRIVPPARFVEADLTDEAGQRADRPPLYDVAQVRWQWLNYIDEDTGELTSYGLYRTTRPAVINRLSDEEAAGVDLLGNDETGPTLWERELAERRGQPLDETLLGVEGADGQGNADTLLTVEHVAPEVQWLYLRYYDGAQWRPNYDAGASGPSPVAVEITIGFAPLLSATQLEAGKTAPEALADLFDEEKALPLPPRTYQRTVYLSAGELFNDRGGVREQRRD